ncbi:FBP domain-containing protein [Streptomyces olivaceus]|uniref:FBP domain-containing protein n=1 Tax=Streptomyces olivaceus TaxID=47716 RepID=A0ABS7VZ11_STROV|nr:FBP domain-containing protein [Streptomyces olivaceus]MBZ6088088.1 FBP domain-containing protein [Streptomyces olivaceus]MBZ6095076.1 FBP domain-containing protein [Streptomyces olivaceus]MBZ6116227.1 FBP domain-containing protein [Streptomyces olivaceus]MBZ6150932.1 FBP domain-containing protein [Streptomyces olivaceus]MBZ6297482.1 FBP domain-containing protein [Streptomyces olivaceus]
MRALAEKDVRASFINCSKGEAKRLAVPRDLGERPWDDLDFLGWRDPGAPDRSYLVTDHDGRLTGVALRFQAARSGFFQRSLCALCLTAHPRGGVSLMTARKAGAAGRQGDSVGLYMCTDLACSLYLRGKKVPQGGTRIEESLTLEEQAARTLGNLSGFLAKVAG